MERLNQIGRKGSLPLLMFILGMIVGNAFVHFVIAMIPFMVMIAIMGFLGRLVMRRYRGHW